MANTKNKPVTTIDIENEEQTMETTQTQTVSILDKITFEQTGEGSYRFNIWNRSDEWDGMLDASFSSPKHHAEGALWGLAKYVAGGYSGNSRLLIVAPEEKFGAAYGSGRMAYVSHEYTPDDALRITLNGQTTVVSVDRKFIPDHGWQPLQIGKGGRLYAESYMTPLTEECEKSRYFWMIEAASLLVQGNVNVGISIGPDLYRQAQNVVDLINTLRDGADAKEEYSAYMHSVREGNRVLKNVRKNAPLPVEVATATVDMYTVPMYGGGEVSLLDWPKDRAINLRNKVGFKQNPVYLRVGDNAERLAVANAIRSQANVGVDIN